MESTFGRYQQAERKKLSHSNRSQFREIRSRGLSWTTTVLLAVLLVVLHVDLLVIIVDLLVGLLLFTLVGIGRPAGAPALNMARLSTCTLRHWAGWRGHWTALYGRRRHGARKVGSAGRHVGRCGIGTKQWRRNQMWRCVRSGVGRECPGESRTVERGGGGSGAAFTAAFTA